MEASCGAHAAEVYGYAQGPSASSVREAPKVIRLAPSRAHEQGPTGPNGANQPRHFEMQMPYFRGRREVSGRANLRSRRARNHSAMITSPATPSKRERVSMLTSQVDGLSEYMHASSVILRR